MKKPQEVLSTGSAKNFRDEAFARTLWTLATYVKTLRPDYEFEFRHHRIDYTDYTISADELAILKYFGLNHIVGTFFEYVLYCR